MDGARLNAQGFRYWRKRDKAVFVSVGSGSIESEPSFTWPEPFPYALGNLINTTYDKSSQEHMK